MNSINLKKQQRITKLWRKVRALVNTGIFISMVKQRTESNLKRQQTGLSDIRHSFLTYNINILKQKHQKFLCIVKYNSNIHIFWDFIISAVYMFSFWLIPINMCPLFMQFDSNQSLELTLDFFSLFDIFFNFIAESVNDVSINIFLRDAARKYLLSYFIVDLLPLASMIFWETQSNLYYLKILRLARIKRMFNFFQHLENLLVYYFYSNAVEMKMTLTGKTFKIV